MGGLIYSWDSTFCVGFGGNGEKKAPQKLKLEFS
jgi:hypothetical protein